MPSRTLNNGLRAALALSLLLIALGLGGGASGCGGDSAQPSETEKTLTALCEETSNGDPGYCDCVAKELIKRGYDTDAEIGQLQSLVIAMRQTGDFSQLPAPVVDALNACQDSTD